MSPKTNPETNSETGPKTGAADTVDTADTVETVETGPNPEVTAEPAAGDGVALSVVVPFRDVGGFLAECLDSIAGQTLRDLQVVMVDDGPADGPADGGAAIAAEFAARDDRFVLVRGDGEGPGPARNLGARHATGRYLAFVDGDDAIPPYAYELLVGMLESTGSDIAGGNLERLDGERTEPSGPHAEAYAETLRATHVTRRLSLLRDRTIGNKVFRRSFWEANKFRFPPGLYEDLPVALATHALASAVDTVPATVYYWRRRPGSLTDRATDPALLNDRHAALDIVQQLFAEHAPSLLPAFHAQVVDVDMHAFVRALPAATPQERERLVELGARIVGEAGPAAAEGLDAIRRLELHLLRERMPRELLEVLAFQEGGLADVPVEARGRFRQRWYARYPFFGDPERAIPDEVYDVTDEFELRADVDRVGWDGDTLIVEGWAHFDRLEVSDVRDSRIRVWMRNVKTGREVGVPVERVRRPEATARSGLSRVCVDWAGFAVRIEPEYLLDGDEWRSGTWELYAEVATAGRRAVQRLDAVEPAVRWTAARQVDELVAVQPAVDDDGFVVHVKRSRAVVTEYRRSGDTLLLTGWTKRALGPNASVIAVRRHGGAPSSHQVRGEVTLRPAAVLQTVEGTGFGFTATLPLADLMPGDASDRPYRAHLRDVLEWDVRLTGEGGPLRLTVAPALTEARFLWRGREYVLTRTSFGNLRGIERTPRPVATAARWDGSGRLTISGEFADPQDRPAHLLVRRPETGETHRVPVTWDGGRFTAAFTPAETAAFGRDIPLAAGTWEVLAPTPAGDVAVVAERSAVPSLPGWHAVGGREFEVAVEQTDALRLRTRPALADDERGPHAQRVLRSRDYPVYLRSPLADVAVFDGYAGTAYSCNPRAIFEELTRRKPETECVWVSRDGQFTVDGEARIVQYGSREHYRLLARARYIVTNYGVPRWFTKRPGQTYLQTWHGTPFKRLAYDLAEMPHQRTEKHDWMEHEVPHWDFLLSPSPYATQIMRRAFRYGGEILETGFPRNDILSSPDVDALGTHVRKELGIPEGKKVVLYAPTWRDDQSHTPGRRGFRMELDVETMRRVLGDDHVLLVRMHHLVTDRHLPPSDDFVMDVSGYPDITDLYMAADVLVTDYSSAAFDFAVLGRPMVFYAHDLERYRDHVRGCYLDLEAEAPGPVVARSVDVAEAVRAAPESEAEHADAYDRFLVTYCPHDDGGATARVLERVFAGLRG
ncbi:bifunctional glycosyltransferase/CDP-glycerol:glycerophosphate glycerophosphotransferase [Actinomadura sp. WMMB 499]|uniref:bifunctional glycosyltransferase/CDP-glycerol:glycerophosphate glycerophosphotransferase n=1 Tax=Actinomadura sp. WMMB 499 TaxID=1219491 RepID=UPI0012441C3B|nr:bifunctional glycosyltransferase/CDP-glycerol:glycerophosphate glycerophosphotransferase [Actinomadura sp. WMMB 499]QFG21886.1 glycosyltransferase [Actinomadura sp. WMMB 499]